MSRYTIIEKITKISTVCMRSLSETEDIYWCVTDQIITKGLVFHRCSWKKYYYVIMKDRFTVPDSCNAKRVVSWLQFQNFLIILLKMAKLYTVLDVQSLLIDFHDCFR